MASEAARQENLQLFSKAVFQTTLPGLTAPSFGSYDELFSYIDSICETERLILVIDEFPYLAASYKAVSSLIQAHIDQKWKNSQLFLILCGSSMSFMEHQVLGYKSPLYGRRTAQFKIHPFTFFEARNLCPEFTREEQAVIYGVTGGIPEYLSRIKKNLSLDENIIELFFNECLNEEISQANPLIGREKELERTMQILCRKEKNNPLHIGEPGVGKTAVVYGLARLLSEGKVPEPLKGAKIYALDLGGMLAGTQYRGDFEKRLKSVLSGLSQEEKPIVYLDEIHNIVGAGAVGEGSLDASNLLKPYLASGKIRFIGATTHEEYKRYFEKSRSLARRFQNVEIAEPGEDEAAEILLGLKTRYEEYHGVSYQNGVIEYMVHMSAKYINERFLPDKAIDLMDEAGAYRKLHPLAQKRQTVGKSFKNLPDSQTDGGEQ